MACNEVPRRFHKKFEHRYDPAFKSDRAPRSDGVYYSKYYWDAQDTQPSFIYILFTQDGWYRSEVPLSDCEDDTKCIQSRMENLTEEEIDLIGWNNYWGLFSIHGDSLFIEKMNRSGRLSLNSTFTIFPTYLKIISDTLITSTALNSEGNPKDSFHFVHVTKVPEFEPWLKSEKWIWESEEAYEQFKNQ